MSDGVLSQLAATIRERRGASAEASYTKSLLEAGTEKCAKKFGEEAVEAVMAAVSESRKDLTNEAADVLYHLLVLLEVRDVELDDVMSVLKARMGVSGHEEKASRSGN